MKKGILLLLAMLPAWVWAQKELVIEGPNDKVAPVVLKVSSDFDPEKGQLRLILTGDDTSECNALWLLQEGTSFGRLEKYFKQNDGKLSLSSFAKEQMKFMNLGEKIADPVVRIEGAQLTDKAAVQTKEGVKYKIQKQILPLDNRSSLVLNLQVAPEAETVTLTLDNPLLLHYRDGKYELAFIGQSVGMDFDLTTAYCDSHAEMLAQLQEYNRMFGKGEETLQQAQSSCIDKLKALLVIEFTQIDFKRFENTKCQEIEDQLAALRALTERIAKFELPKEEGGGSGGGGGGGAGAGASGAPAIDDCNTKKLNDDLKAAVVKLNTYANDWISANDPTVKQAKKLAFDGLVKETDAKVNALAPACKKKLDGGALKNYEMAKKLIKN